MKILIKNGLIVDGSGNDGYKGDVLIYNERIEKISNEINNENVDKIINADGLVIAPGFIDTHSHSDLKILENPYNETKIRQGITTEVLGQDGISMAPLPKEHVSSWRKNLAGLDGESDEINWNYETTDNYLKMMEDRGVGLNEAYLVPHGNVRMEVLGLDNIQPDEEQLKKMCEVTRREMEAGAYGLSTGLIYIPCAYSQTRELVELCKVVAEFDGVFVIHQRSEADSIISSMKEVIEIGEKSGVRVHFSHFKVCGKKNWKYVDEVLILLNEARKKGIKVTLDQYPYATGSTMLGVILPPWAHDGGTDKLLERLASPEMREQMIRDMKNNEQNDMEAWDNFIDFAGLDGIYITSVKHKKNEIFIGKNLVEIGELKGKDPYNATFDLLLEEENAVGMFNYYGIEKHIIKFMKLTEQNVCTDGLLSGKPHPRAYGSFPRILGRFVRKLNVLTLEEAVMKMTSKAAKAFSIKNRGILKEGYFADIVIFNKDSVIDKGTFEEPIQYPEGIEYVIINGQLAVENGEYKKVKAGMVLRKV
ncbi:N-acyl-D-amino-acid deacylase [Clostridium cavendishii DSM 21758]|uniref:N-acyl-D-amino-acid deacylase n=1 Tax=Clostridium cavendishii DSM 21758 TaxID=1121302 RepID=A0A1M6DL65_9CLOT|nr:D-aminoacylase [Clostridium cavendishii]SHI73883.1 N-acyl-D-amino-acid deacylase [Clostridium cavendishii DSM 21758]